MRFSVGYDLGSFFSGLGEEGMSLAHLFDSQTFAKHGYQTS